MGTAGGAGGYCEDAGGHWGDGFVPRVHIGCPSARGAQTIVFQLI